MKVYEIKRNHGFNAFHETSVKLAEAIEKSGINEKMKGFGFSTIPKLVYRDAGLKYEKQKSGSFRSTLDSDDLRKVIEIENVVVELLILEKDYNEIKEELLEGL